MIENEPVQAPKKAEPKMVSETDLIAVKKREAKLKE